MQGLIRTSVIREALELVAEVAASASLAEPSSYRIQRVRGHGEEALTTISGRASQTSKNGHSGFFDPMRGSNAKK